MIRVGGGIVICHMAAHAGVGYLGVVIAVMTGSAGNRGMGSGQHVIVAVYGKCSWLPSGGGRMAIGTGSRKCQCRMVRISGIVIIRLVASHTGIGRVYVIAVVAGNAGSRGMSPGQRIIIIMDGKSRRFPAWVRRMAIGTCVRNILTHMVRVC